MRTQSADTDPDAELNQIRVLRQMPVWERLAQVDALIEFVETLTLADLRRRDPAATPQQLRRQVIARRLIDLGVPHAIPSAALEADEKP